MALSDNLTPRIERILAYHRSSKLTPASVRADQHPLDWANRPNPYRIFDGFPKTDLPTTLLDLPGDTLDVLRTSLDAIPDSHQHPPQDLKTLASWLYMADGLTVKKEAGHSSYFLRTCPSAGALYPYEIYVLALGLKDLAPGFYHYSPREFSLRLLRHAPESLALIKRTWPDVGFLKSVPALLLISSIFSRSSWKYRQRGYRYALLDSGHLLQNVVTSAIGLGIQTIVRMGVHYQAMEDLIGIPDDVEYAQAEAVQSMVVWAEKSHTPIQCGPLPLVKNISTLPREPLAARTVNYDAAKVHEACCAAGVVVREIRPKLTELSPLAATHEPADVTDTNEFPHAASLRQSLLQRRSARDFLPQPIARPTLWTLNRVAFRSGSFHPIRPDGPHVGIVRPFWILNEVTGLDRGIWYYHPAKDQWHQLYQGNCKKQIQHLALDQPLCRNAAAVCVLAADFNHLMNYTGPDAYRLAHLEAGAVGQRLALACSSLHLSCTGIGAFYDDDLRTYLGLEKTTWEIIYTLALGAPTPDSPQETAAERPDTF
jgi:SagB-type dehydrogenase family enzyme